MSATHPSLGTRPASMSSSRLRWPGSEMKEMRLPDGVNDQSGVREKEGGFQGSSDDQASKVTKGGLQVMMCVSGEGREGSRRYR